MSLFLLTVKNLGAVLWLIQKTSKYITDSLKILFLPFLAKVFFYCNSTKGLQLMITLTATRYQSRQPPQLSGNFTLFCFFSTSFLFRKVFHSFESFAEFAPFRNIDTTVAETFSQVLKCYEAILKLFVPFLFIYHLLRVSFRIIICISAYCCININVTISFCFVVYISCK